MKSTVVLFICTFVFLLGCSIHSVRTPASVSTSTQSLSDWGRSVTEYTGFVRSNSFTPSTCSSLYTDIARKLDSFDFALYSNQELEKESGKAISNLWQLRLQLHSHLAEVSPSCRLQVREIFHRLRDLDDYFGEFAYRTKPLSPAVIDFQTQKIPIYDRKAYAPYNVRADLDDEQFQFHSGDVMLMRGISFFSAIISQISDNRSEFSHALIVNEEPNTKKLNTVESYIGSGVAKYDMDFALKNENARILVLRPKDRTLGEKAAGQAMDSAKAKIPYDYNMNFKDYSKMSCVEVVRSAYDRASNGAVMTPAQPAKLNFKSSVFLDKMNLKNGDLITPDDLEIDSHFELLLDWRDYRLIRDSRQKDAILSEMLRWVNDLGYKFHDTPKSFFAKNIILPISSTRLWPFVKKITASPDVDPSLPKKTMGMMLVLNQMGQNLLERLDKEDALYVSKYRRPMTNGQLRIAVNKLREQDLKEFKEGAPTFMHYALRPDGVYRGTPSPDGK